MALYIWNDCDCWPLAEFILDLCLVLWLQSKVQVHSIWVLWPLVPNVHCPTKPHLLNQMANKMLISNNRKNIQDVQQIHAQQINKINTGTGNNYDSNVHTLIKILLSLSKLGFLVKLPAQEFSLITDLIIHRSQSLLSRARLSARIPVATTAM